VVVSKDDTSLFLPYMFTCTFLQLNTVSTKLGETLDKNRQLEEEKVSCCDDMKQLEKHGFFH